MNLPRLLTDDGKGIKSIIHPMHVSLDLNIVPLSYASIKLSNDEYLPSKGLVELFCPYGSVGVFRVRNPQDAYGSEVTTAELEHSIAEVGDYLVKEKIDEMMSADSAMKRMFKHYKGKLWTLGNVSALGTGKVAVSVNYNRVLDSMLAILEQKKDCMMAFDFSTSPWTVNIVKKGTVVEAEGRLSRNVSSARVSYDDTEQCTRVFYEIIDKNGNSTWKSKDADNILQEGVFEKELSIDSSLTDAEIDIVVNTYLNEHKKARVGVSIEGNDLSHITGESFDKFALGKMFRLTIAEKNVVIEDVIVNVSWSDLYGRPRDVVINIGDTEDTVVTFLHNLDSKGAGGGGGGGGKKKEEEKEKEWKADFYKTDKTVGMYAQRINKHDDIFEKAGLDVNSQGVLIYTEVKNGLGSRIQTQKDRIDLVVKGEGKNAKIDIAQIITSINKEEGSKIKLSAKTIDLEGYVTMKQFSAQRATINNLISGNTSFTNLVGRKGSFNSLYLGGSQLSRTTLMIDGVRHNIVTWYGSGG